MGRKRLTQLLPWLIPIRKKQRVLCFYLKMRFDGNRYAKSKQKKLLPYPLFETNSPLYHTETGFDMVYQENKVHNLKLAALRLDRLIIKPGETFSFWQIAKHADRFTPYKAGLTIHNGTMKAIPGGGMCQMSNLLYWMFLHSPLTIIERHGHGIKYFPEPVSNAPTGVDATITEGWLDLKVRNNTDETFQIEISFDSGHIIGRLYTDRKTTISYEIINQEPLYYKKETKVFEKVDVIQNILSKITGQCVMSKVLYTNQCEIKYKLPKEAESKIGEWI